MRFDRRRAALFACTILLAGAVPATANPKLPERWEGPGPQTDVAACAMEPDEDALRADLARCLDPWYDAARSSSPSGGPGPEAPCVPVALVDDQCESWTAIHDPEPGWGLTMGVAVGQPAPCDAPSTAACNTEGGRVFTTGWEDPPAYGTVAYDATTGGELWTARYRSGGFDEVYDIGTSPDGARVFVTGRCCGSWSGGSGIAGWQYATVAYDGATGAQLWASRHDGEDPAVTDLALSLDVAPDGERIFVTGVSGRDAVTIAYDAGTGAEAWRAAYAGPEGGVDQGFEVVAAPDGDRVFVAGGSWGGGGSSNYDYLIVAYDAVTGAELWATRLDNGVQGFDVAQTLAVSPDGARLVASGIGRVAGTTPGGLFANSEFLTVGVDAATGDIAWTARYAGAAGGLNGANDVVVAPDGEGVFITGTSTSANAMDIDVVTIAYDAQTGEESWVARLATPGYWSEVGNRVGVTPDSSRVFVSGYSLAVQGNAILGSDTVTLAYNTVTGAQAWAARQNTSPGRVDLSFAGYLAVSPGGEHVYTAGVSVVRGTGGVFVTMAYPARAPLEVPTPTESPTPTPSESSTTPSPSPSESPQPETTTVTFTGRSATAGQYSDQVLFEAQLTDSNGDRIAGQELTFELAGEESTRSFSGVTDGNGVASVSPTLEEKPGPHQLTVRYSGDEDRAGDADSISFVVNKEDTALELSVHGEDDDKTLRTRLSDLDTSSEGIAQRTIDFYSDGELIGSRQTDADGVASVALPPGHRGNNRTYEAVFDGDDFYLGSSEERTGKGKGGNDGGSGGSGSDGEGGRTYAGRMLLM